MLTNDQIDISSKDIYDKLTKEKIDDILLGMSKNKISRYDITKHGYVGDGLYCLGGMAYTGKKGWDQFNKELSSRFKNYHNKDIFKMNNKNSKYYTPSIDEFYVGFEFETNYSIISGLFGNESDKFVKLKFTKENISNWIDLYIEDAYPSEFRVKYLDKDDIIELGFKLIDNESYERTNNGKFIFNYRYKKDTLILTYTNWFVSDGKEYRVVRIEDNADYINDKDESGNITNTLFSGNIKNKSELSKLLKQIY